MKTVFGLALAALLLVAGCVFEGPPESRLVWRADSSGPGTPFAGAHGRAADGSARENPNPLTTRTRAPDSGAVVKIPLPIMKKLMAFVNEAKIVIADRVEVDASTIPFRVAMVPVSDPDSVEKVQLVAEKLKATGILLRSKVKAPMVESDYCRLRIGDGIDLVAGRQIEARSYNAVDPDRPAFLVVTAEGHAVYKNGVTGRRIAKDRIVVRAEILRRHGHLVFVKSVR